MGAVSEYISNIEGKVDQLVDHLSQLESEKAELAQQKQDLEKHVDSQQQRIAELENQLKMIKIAKQIDSGGDNSEVKKKITEFIKEIDNCIALLNN